MIGLDLKSLTQRLLGGCAISRFVLQPRQFNMRFRHVGLRVTPFRQQLLCLARALLRNQQLSQGVGERFRLVVTGWAIEWYVKLQAFRTGRLGHRGEPVGAQSLAQPHRHLRALGDVGRGAWVKVEHQLETWREKGQRTAQWFPLQTAVEELQEPGLQAILLEVGEKARNAA